MVDSGAPTVEQARRRRARLVYEAREQKTVRDLVTPEGAALKLKIATSAERAGAFIIDFIIIVIVIVLGVLAIAYVALELGLRGWNIAGAVATLFFFAVRNFYFVAFELGRRAATPGKRLLGLRVAARNGGRLSANAVFARNFLREIEVFLPLTFLLSAGNELNGWIALLGLTWSCIFLFFPVFNKDKLRAGDILAGTWVIHAPKIKLQSDVTGSPTNSPNTSVAGSFAFTTAQLDAYGIHELHVLENVLRQSNDTVKASVAERIREKIGWTAGADETDLEFLTSYYAGLRRHLEQKLLLGKRKTDKFDRS